MCVTMYVVCMVCTVFLLLYPCPYMTHQHNVCLANIFADAKHACLVIKNYNSLTQCTSCKHFMQRETCLPNKCKTCLPDNQNCNSATKRTFCKHFTWCQIQHDRGPLADKSTILAIPHDAYVRHTKHLTFVCRFVYVHHFCVYRFLWHLVCTLYMGNDLYSYQ